MKKDENQFIDKSSGKTNQLFKQAWLGRYPRPKQVISDNGSECKMNFEEQDTRNTERGRGTLKFRIVPLK